MRTLLVILCYLMISPLLGQETVVWASEIIEVSSEYGPLEYSALQALHKPNVYPGSGANPNAWRPKNNDKDEFIVVSFEHPIQAQQIAIAETQNPGAIKEVIAYDEEYRDYTLFKMSPRTLPIDKRLLNLFFEETSYKIRAIKIVLDCGAVPGFNSIDAIGVSKSNIPINVLIQMAAAVNQNINAEKLGVNVNSQYVEHSPIISPDGKRLYFSRKYHPDNAGGVDDSEDIWVSDLDEETGEWLPATNVGPPLNTEGPNFISSITIVDGKEVVILGNRYGKKGRMYTGVSTATRQGDTFSKPESIEVENEYNYSPKVDFFLAPGGEVMLQSVERDDVFGGRDLYVSFKKSKNAWSEPENMGSTLNTAAEEAAPFLAKDGKTLYYSSGGFGGYGLLDIFVSKRLDDTWKNWSPPDNLGSGINTNLDDQYFSIPSSGKHLYFTRGKVDEDTDIFRFKVDEFLVDPTADYAVEHLIEKPKEVIITIAGSVKDIESNEPIIGADVLLERLPDGIEIGTTSSNAAGVFSFIMRPGARFGFSANYEGYIGQSENIDLNDVKESDTISINLLLSKIEVGQPILINNIFFAFDKSELTTASYSELERILEYVKSGRLKRIAVHGHTDAKGPAEYNLKLSQRRAKAVYNYFVNNGVDRANIDYKGFGETKPVAPNDTDENMQKNRRVEFEILEAGD